MGIALSLQQYLDGRGVSYDVITHDRALRSSTTAQTSGIPERNLAKGVLIKRKDGFVLAIVPASHHVELNEVGSWAKQPVGLATVYRTLALLSEHDVVDDAGVESIAITDRAQRLRRELDRGNTVQRAVGTAATAGRSHMVEDECVGHVGSPARPANLTDISPGASP